MSRLADDLSQYSVSTWKNPTDKQWRTSMAIQMIPGGLLFLGMLFQKESPRYLISRGRQEEAVEALTYIRQLPLDHPVVATEIAEITQSIIWEQSSLGGSSTVSLIKEIFVVPANRRRYAMAMLLQVWQQMTGTNAINYFAPSIFASIGLAGTSSSLLATGVYGIVKIITVLFMFSSLWTMLGDGNR